MERHGGQPGPEQGDDVGMPIAPIRVSREGTGGQLGTHHYYCRMIVGFDGLWVVRRVEDMWKTAAKERVRACFVCQTVKYRIGEFAKSTWQRVVMLR